MWLLNIQFTLIYGLVVDRCYIYLSRDGCCVFDELRKLFPVSKPVIKGLFYHGKSYVLVLVSSSTPGTSFLEANPIRVFEPG
jgi:hypothetical protein